MVGEWGQGKFPAGYPGSEHTEFPSKAVEPGDSAACIAGDWCNQYAHDEAASITDPDIPWWSACNTGQTDWDVVHEPMEAALIEGGIRLKYEAPLVKEADGDGTFDGDACHQNWLFPDGIRRAVYLQLGYEFFSDTTHLDRVVSIRNPAENPEFTGPMSVIGGFVLTQWPNPHPLIGLDAFFRPTIGSFDDPTHGIPFVADTWNDHQFPAQGGDEVFGWINNPFSLSAFPLFAAGRSASLSHIGPSDNNDAGFCLCSVHGGLEMGGGLLHGGMSLPIDGGTSSIEARRRLDLPGDPLLPKTLVYEAETDLQHATGKADDDGWSANTAEHTADHMIYGPYATDWYGNQGTATFRMMVDNIDADDLEVVAINVHDATTQTNLAEMHITRTQFNAPYAYQDFTVNFDLQGRIGHAMELRAFWTDFSYVKVDKVTVALTP